MENEKNIRLSDEGIGDDEDLRDQTLAAQGMRITTPKERREKVFDMGGADDGSFPEAGPVKIIKEPETQRASEGVAPMPGDEGSEVEKQAV